MSGNHHSRKDRDREREEIFSRKVSAGRRTYFFDVRSTKFNDYFVAITESKKRTGDDGQAYYEKHKIFIYRQDFDNIMEAFNECMDKVRDLHGNAPAAPAPENTERENEPRDTSGSSFSDVNFEDLK
jgi:hypothetical protein